MLKQQERGKKTMQKKNKLHDMAKDKTSHTKQADTESQQ